MADEKQTGRQSAAAAKAAEKEAVTKTATDEASQAEAAGSDGADADGPKDRPVQRSAARYESAEHIELARGMYRQPKHVVAAAIALVQERENGNVREGYTKQEVEAAIADLDSVEVKES